MGELRGESVWESTPILCASVQSVSILGSLWSCLICGGKREELCCVAQALCSVRGDLSIWGSEALPLQGCSALRRAAVSNTFLMAEMDGDNFLCCSEQVLDLLPGLWIICPHRNSGVDVVTQFPFLMLSYYFSTCPLNLT